MHINLTYSIDMRSSVVYSWCTAYRKQADSIKEIVSFNTMICMPLSEARPLLNHNTRTNNYRNIFYYSEAWKTWNNHALIYIALTIRNILIQKIIIQLCDQKRWQ